MDRVDTITATPRRRPRWRWVLLAALLALVALVWSTGGFKGGSESFDENTNQPFSIKAANLTVTDATAQKSYDNSWTVTVHALCVVTAQQPPTDLSDGFAFGSTTKPAVIADNYAMTIAPTSQFGPHRDYLGPDLAPMVCAFKGSMPASWRPATGIRLGFTDYEYGDNSVTGDQAPHWYPGQVTHMLRMPVTVLRQS